MESYGVYDLLLGITVESHFAFEGVVMISHLKVSGDSPVIRDLVTKKAELRILALDCWQNRIKVL